MAKIQEYKLKLEKKTRLNESISEFCFVPDSPIKWTAGQYLRFTLDHANPDRKGRKRWFTISSSPTEKRVCLTTRINNKGVSSFKKALDNLPTGGEIVAGELDGDFVLPEKRQKLAFIAGGIGVTPFHSIVKYLVDKKEKWDIELLYFARSESDFVYRDLFESAQLIGLKTTYKVTNDLPSPDYIKKQTPDWSDRLFYIAGPEPMVKELEKALVASGVKDDRIMIDDFPGYEY